MKRHSLAIGLTDVRKVQARRRESQLERELVEQVQALKARARRWGLSQRRWREMRDPWWGCPAGAAMALHAPAGEVSALWQAICDIRQVVARYDSAIHAPRRHPRNAMGDSGATGVSGDDADAKDMRAMQRLHAALGPDSDWVIGVVVDDWPCREPDRLVDALRRLTGG